MASWQRRARLLIAVAAVAFAIVVVLAFKPRAPQPAPVPVVATDPEALVESASGSTIRLNGDREEVRIEYQKLLTYQDGTVRMIDMKVTTERAGGRTFVLSGREGEARRDQSAFEISGSVELRTNDGLVVRGDHATYAEEEGIVRVPGPVEFDEGRVHGTGVGMTYDKNRDVLTLMNQALVRIAPSSDGTDGADITAGTAEFSRDEEVIRFDRSLKALRQRETVEADRGVAQLAGEDSHLEALKLEGTARIDAVENTPGGLRTLSGGAIDLDYAADGRTLQAAQVRGNGILVLAGGTRAQDRRVQSDEMTMAFGSDGTTLTEIVTRGGVRMTLPGAVARTVTADLFEGKGQNGAGVSVGHFSGHVVFREQAGPRERAGRSNTLDVSMAPGLGDVESALFTGSFTFVDGPMTATATKATYAATRGTLELRQAAAGDAACTMVNERMRLEAQQIDITLEGPIIRAAGTVKSELLPAKESTAAANAKASTNPRLPSMLKADQPVIVVADALTYDGPGSMATYDGSARLSQGDTSIRGASISLNEKSGDLTAKGSVVTTSVLNQTTNGKTERVPSIARSELFVFEQAQNRATYTTGAQVGGPHGEMRARQIQLYLRPSGNELERVEAHDDVELMEQKRKTTGTQLTYFSEDSRYVVLGTPVKVVDECSRETIGRTLTFFQNTDRIVVDGNEQIRTRTSGVSQCS